jgi:hypothetical protein
MSDFSVQTHSGHWGWTEHRYFGHAVFGELLGRETVTGLTVLSVLGRSLPPECLGVIDDLAVSLTLADPRIWPLKLTRLLASYGGTAAALGGSLSLQEGARIGPWTAQRAAGSLLKLHAELGEHRASPEHVRQCVLGHLAQNSVIWGFGTPFRDRDERLVAFRQRMLIRERHALPFWRLFEAVADVVVEARGTQPNIGMGLAAACLDMGLEASEIGPLAIALMQHMFLAHAVEQVKSPSRLLRELPHRQIAYVGRAARRSPRALGAATP